MSSKFFLLWVILIFLVSCSKKNEVLYEPSKQINPYETYKEGYEAFLNRDFFFAEKKFSEAELNFESVELAAKSSIMASFSLYSINFYEEALENLKNFIKKYPLDKNNIYANYLEAVIYFEQIEDEKKDLKPLLQAQKKINFFLEKYPNIDYATDLRFKKNFIDNQLAAKELYIARYYISLQKWVPAVNRLKVIIEKYEKTIFIEEALHRLVEIYYNLGLEKEAESYAKILGYNYNSSQWFEMTYKVLNKNYEIVSNKKAPEKKNNRLFKKIIDTIK